MIQMEAHGCQLGQCEDHANQGLEFREKLFPVLQDEYWHRVWTQQEMLLASEIVVHCRGVCFKGNLWLNLQFIIFNTYSGWLDLKSEIPDIMFEFHRKYPEYLITKSLRNTLVGAKELLHNLFSHVYALKATDDRDKLYGILGLVDSIPESIVVNYSLSTAQVYSQLFNHIIEQGKSLEFLCCVPNVDKSLPSWFPSLDKVEAARWDLHSKQSACSNIPAAAKIISSGITLRVRGFQVDVVLRKSEDELVSNSAVKWLGEVREMSQEAFLTSGGSSGSADDAVAKLLFWWKSTALYSQFPLLASGHALADTEVEKRVAWTHLMEALDKDQGLNLINLAAAHPPAEIKKIIPFLRYSSQILQNQSFISTCDRGMLGLASSRAKPGDGIWILFGCRAPVILWPSGTHHTYISPARIADVSEGQACVGLLGDGEPGLGYIGPLIRTIEIE